MFDAGAKEFDVIICGAGPAGCTCALTLADSGLRVAVLEKNSFPRRQDLWRCGGCLCTKSAGYHQQLLTRSLEDFTEKINVNTCRLVAPIKSVRPPL